MNLPKPWTDINCWSTARSTSISNFCYNVYIIKVKYDLLPGFFLLSNILKEDGHVLNKVNQFQNEKSDHKIRKPNFLCVSKGNEIFSSPEINMMSSVRRRAFPRLYFHLLLFIRRKFSSTSLNPRSWYANVKFINLRNYIFIVFWLWNFNFPVRDFTLNCKENSIRMIYVTMTGLIQIFWRKYFFSDYYFSVVFVCWSMQKPQTFKF